MIQYRRIRDCTCTLGEVSESLYHPFTLQKFLTVRRNRPSLLTQCLSDFIPCGQVEAL